jgi:uncharacterized Ntn-hydrolase superfamily protein
MSPSEYLAATFSILGYDPNAQEWGVAVQSKAFVVGGIVPWAQAGVGAIATQAWTNKSFGPRGLALLKRGHDPKDVIDHLIRSDTHGARRQLAVMDAQGRTANYTGQECLPWAGGIAEPNVSVQGNILAGERVVKQMLAAFQKTRGKLAERLIAALEAGQRAGGDTRGQQSAALLVVREKSDIDGVGDVYVDLRVDDHKTPIAELRRLYGIWETEMYPHLESNRINALLREKKYARAQRLHREFSMQAERLARQHPQDANLLNTLAWQLAQNALGLDAAHKYAQRAVKLAPQDANILDTLAEVLYQRGQVARAIEIETDLVAKNPQRADFRAQLEKFTQAVKPKRRR